MTDDHDFWLALLELGIEDTEFYRDLLQDKEDLTWQTKLSIIRPFLDTWGRYHAVLRYLNDD